MLGQHINHCEDSLTAAVFSHLLHLPAELFWQILRDACHSPNLPPSAGEPECEFWPKWEATGTNNSSYVEPDVFIRFPVFDLIIEAKRWDGAMQDLSQWQRELAAYANEYGGDNRPVRMIALGSVDRQEDMPLTHQWRVSEAGGADTKRTRTIVCPVHMCRWNAVLVQCQRMLGSWQRLAHPTSQSLAIVRVLGDVIDLFGWHGFSTGSWFADFDFAKHRLSPAVPRHLQLFQHRSKEFSHP